MRKTLCSIVAAGLLAVASPKAEAQQVKDNPAVTYGINVGINGLVSGIGYLLSDKSFFEGFAIGAAAGTLSTAAKYVVGKNLDYAWPAKILNSIGSSMAYNAARGEKPFEALRMDIGPIMLEYSDGKIHPYIIPSSVLSTLYFTCKGYTLNWNESARIGTILFEHNSVPGGFDGGSSSGVIVLKNSDLHTNTERHELIHGFQRNESQSFAGLFSNASNDVNRYAAWLNEHHVDYALDNGSALFLLATQLPFPYMNRPIEREAHGLAH